MKALFAKGETPFAKQKLAEALQQINDSGKRVVAQPELSVYKQMPKATDAVLKAIENEWKPKYQRMNFLRHKLDEFIHANDPIVQSKCKEICKEILELEQECMVLWEKRNHYIETGKIDHVKEKDFVIPEDAVALGKMIEKLKRYVRRYKKSLSEHPDNSTYAALLKKYEDQLTLIHDSQKKN